MPAASRLAICTATLTLICVIALFSFAYKATTGDAKSISEDMLQSISNHFEGQSLASGAKLPRLSKKLIQQHAVNNTIIVAFANANHIDYTFNWLSYIYALEISNYIIGAADATTAEALAEYDVNYFAMYGGRNKNLQQLPAGDLAFLSPGFLSIGQHKLVLIQTILSYKVNIVLSDVDTVWLQDPLPYFAKFPQADILATSDTVAPTHDDEGLEDPQVMGRYELNIGVMLMRYSKNMTHFAAAWQSMMQQRDTQHWDQADFNILLRSNMFKDHHSWWDHTDRCDRTYVPSAALKDNERIVWGWDHSITVGALPVSMFANGHVFFTQRLYETLHSRLHMVHANFVAGGHKRHRFRDSQLWQYDQPKYYDPERLLSFDMHSLDAPQDWLKLPTRARVRFHVQNIATQLEQFWAAAAAAVALNRVLILPTFLCHCDEAWWWSLEVAPSWKCRWPGALNQTLPFRCPMDIILNLMQMADEPNKHGVALKYRESSFLDNPRTPDTIKADVVRIQLQMPAERSVQDSSIQEVNQTAMPWVVTESELRDTLSQYSQHRVLHFAEMGRVLLNSYRMWDRRRAHATHDNWRITQFSAVQ